MQPVNHPYTVAVKFTQRLAQTPDKLPKQQIQSPESHGFWRNTGKNVLQLKKFPNENDTLDKPWCVENQEYIW